MLRKRMSILIAMVLVIAMFSGCTMLGEDYVAKVGQEKITKSEYSFFLKDAENTITNLFGGNTVDWTQKIGDVTAKEYAKQAALSSAVDLEIQLMKAQEAKITLTKAEIDDLNSQIDTSVKSLGTTGIDQEKALKEKTGVSVADFKKVYQKITLAKKFVGDVEGKYTFTDADLKTHYEANKKSLDKVTVGHILFLTVDANGQALPKDKQDAAKKNADETLAKVNAAGDFAALAKQYSEDGGSKDNGGTYTITKNGQMVAEFENWAFDPARKLGDTGIINTSYGYHVMKMEKIFTYDDIKADVKNSFLSKKYSDELEVWKKDTAKYAVVKNSKVLDLITVPMK